MTAGATDRLAAGATEKGAPVRRTGPHSVKIAALPSGVHRYIAERTFCITWSCAQYIKYALRGTFRHTDYLVRITWSCTQYIGYAFSCPHYVVLHNA